MSAGMFASKQRLIFLPPLISLLHGTPAWEYRYDVEIYVHKCHAAGFCNTPDQARMCAERYVAGKRKVTPPGTKRRKDAEKKKLKFLANIPPELLVVVEKVISENAKAIEQYKNGVERALNALVGGVMKQYKADPAIVKDLLIEKIKSL